MTRGVILGHPATGDLPFRIGAALMSGPPLAALDLCEKASDLAVRLAKAPDVCVLVVGLYDERGLPIAGRLASLRARFPRIPFILYAKITNRDSESLLAAVRSGVTQVVLRDGVSDVPALRSAITECLPAGSLNRSLHTIDDLISPEGREILTWCLDHAAKRLSVRMVAEGLGKDRSTLNRHLRRCGLPPTERVISWCRLLHIAQELDRGVLSVAMIAGLLDFGVASSLRTFVRRHVGLSVSELKLKGAVDAVLRMMRARLTDCTDDSFASSFDEEPLLAVAGH